MAGAIDTISKTQQFFKNLVPEWLYSKTAVGKAVKVALLAFASVVALGWIVKSLRGRATKFEKKTAPEQTQSPISETKPPSGLGKKPDPKPHDSKSTTVPLPPTPSSIPPSPQKIIAQKDVGYGNTLYVNGSPMKNNGIPTRWEIDGISSKELVFSIKHPDNSVRELGESEVPFTVEDAKTPL